MKIFSTPQFQISQKAGFFRLQAHHTIIRAAFVRLFVNLLLRGPLTDLRQTWWVYVGGTSELPLRGSFFKSSTGQRVNGSNVTFSEQTTPGSDHTAAKGVPSKRHTASKSLIPSTGIFTSMSKINVYIVVGPYITTVHTLTYCDINS